MQTTEEILLKNELYYHQLTSLGSYYPLSPFFDKWEVSDSLNQFKDDWKVYNSFKPGYKRHGLSLTSLDGQLTGVPDLTSLTEHNLKHGTDYHELSFRTPTPVFEKCKVLQPLLDPLRPYLGRSHFLRLDLGGFFPYHRDSYGLKNSSFRIFIPLYGHSTRDFIFLIGNDRIEMEVGRPYFINTRMEHALFALDNNCLSLVLNIEVCQQSVDVVQDLLFSR